MEACHLEKFTPHFNTTRVLEGVIRHPNNPPPSDAYIALKFKVMLLNNIVQKLSKYSKITGITHITHSNNLISSTSPKITKYRVHTTCTSPHNSLDRSNI